MIWIESKAWQSKKESHSNQSFLKLFNWTYSITKIDTYDLRIKCMLNIQEIEKITHIFLNAMENTIQNQEYLLKVY